MEGASVKGVFPDLLSGRETGRSKMAAHDVGRALTDITHAGVKLAVGPDCRL